MLRPCPRQEVRRWGGTTWGWGGRGARAFLCVMFGSFLLNPVLCSVDCGHCCRATFSSTSISARFTRFSINVSVMSAHVERSFGLAEYVDGEHRRSLPNGYNIEVDAQRRC